MVCVLCAVHLTGTPVEGSCPHGGGSSVRLPTHLLQVAKKDLLILHLVRAHGASPVQDCIQGFLIEHLYLWDPGSKSLDNLRRSSSPCCPQTMSSLKWYLPSGAQSLPSAFTAISTQPVCPLLLSTCHQTLGPTIPGTKVTGPPQLLLPPGSRLSGHDWGPQVQQGLVSHSVRGPTTGVVVRFLGQPVAASL